jgi:hypothetical protein
LGISALVRELKEAEIKKIKTNLRSLVDLDPLLDKGIEHVGFLGNLGQTRKGIAEDRSDGTAAKLSRFSRVKKYEEYAFFEDPFLEGMRLTWKRIFFP